MNHIVNSRREDYDPIEVGDTVLIVGTLAECEAIWGDMDMAEAIGKELIVGGVDQYTGNIRCGDWYYLPCSVWLIKKKNK